MKSPHDLTGQVPELLIAPNIGGVLSINGLMNPENMMDNKKFGHEIIWSRVIFCSRKHNAAKRIATFSLN